MGAPLLLVAVICFALGWVAGRGSGRRARDLWGPPLPAVGLSALGPAVRAEIEAAIADGHKIEAIKLLRDATGMGLRESKEAVEAMERA